MIPEMMNRGYSKEFSCSLTAAAGSIGPIIPPSIPLIIYGVIANVSVVKLFVAGYVPGILMGILFMIYTYFFAKKHNYPAENKPSIRETLIAFKEAFLTLLLPVVIMGSILLGICTATEAAVLAVVYAIILGFFVYKTLNLKKMKDIFLGAARSTSMVFMVMASAALLSWVVTMMNVPQAVSNLIFSFTDKGWVFLIIVNLLLIIVGMFLDAGSAITILTPVLLPVAVALNVDPLVFGIIFAVNMSIGVLTPPVGLNLYIVSSIGKIDILKVSKAVIPFILLVFLILIVASVFPQVITFLPNLIYGA